MSKLQPIVTEVQINNLIDSLTKGLDYNFMNDLTIKFYKFLIYNLNYDLKKIKLGLILDTNQILKDINYAAKNNESFLEKLLSHNFLDIKAPIEIFQEVENNLKDFVNIRKKITIDKLRKVWNHLKTRIKIVKSSERAYKLVEKLPLRDQSDSSFIALYIDTGADAIMTQDKDITELPLISTTNTGKVNKLTIEFDRGIISFTIISSIPHLLSKVLKFFIGLILKLFKIVDDFLRPIVKFLSEIIVKRISNLDILNIIAILGSASIFVLLYLKDNQFKKSVDSIVLPLLNNLNHFIDIIIKQLGTYKHLLKFLNLILFKLSINLLLVLSYLMNNFSTSIQNLSKLRIINNNNNNININRINAI